MTHPASINVASNVKVEAKTVGFTVVLLCTSIADGTSATPMAFPAQMRRWGLAFLLLSCSVVSRPRILGSDLVQQWLCVTSFVGMLPLLIVDFFALIVV
jgi:hypothetical protein